MSKLLMERDLRDWAENPVTELIKTALEAELDRVFEQRTSTYVRGNPNATQEAIANLLGAELRLKDLIDILGADDSGGAFHVYFGIEVQLVKEIEDEE